MSAVFLVTGVVGIGCGLVSAACLLAAVKHQKMHTIPLVADWALWQAAQPNGARAATTEEFTSAVILKLQEAESVNARIIERRLRLLKRAITALAVCLFATILQAGVRLAPVIIGAFFQ